MAVHSICILNSCIASNYDPGIYSTNHPQLEWYKHVTRMRHAWSETHMHGFLRQHMCVHAHAVFTYRCFLPHVHTCMANVGNQLVSYLPFSLSYNASILATLFFLYRALAAHQWVEDEITEEVESTSIILQLATSCLMEAFPFSEVTVYYTRCLVKSHH